MRYTFPMRLRGRLITIFLLVVAAVIVLFFLFRRTRADYGPAVALCPGPDLYGYTCESGTAFAYLNATNDTRLYQDDGVVTLELPFPFTFYGTTYTEVQASSNGNLQFENSNPNFANQCMDEEPVAGMGDMIAPFWDDLDLRAFGFLETEVFGEEPTRIFVIEWDNIPRFGDPEDRTTFEVQLFEESHDIVFLYEDVTMFEGNNGASATIGIQSEDQGVALQFSCFQPAVANASRIRFPHPADPNPDVEPQTGIRQASPFSVNAKGDIQVLIDQLNLHGRAAIPTLHTQWLHQTPPLTAVWEWANITGDHNQELILVRHSTAQYAHLTQLTVLGSDASGQTTLLLDEALSNREQLIPQIAISDIADLTGDDRDDVLLHDETTGYTFVLTAVADTLKLLSVPEQCFGSIGIVDTNHDGRLEIARDGCERNGRVIYFWHDGSFISNEE
jgi:hypothetical protein